MTVNLEKFGDGCGPISTRPTTLRSGGGYTLSNFVIENHSNEIVFFYWVGFDRSAAHFYTIPDEGNDHFRAYIGHVFIATLEKGTILTMNGECFWQFNESTATVVLEDLNN